MGNSSENHRKWTIIAAGIPAFCFIAWGIWSRLPPPQLKADEQVLNTVDALFTALTSRDAHRLTACETRFAEYRQANRLPAAAGRRLDQIIAMARKGDWQPAAEQLYAFVMAQRGKVASAY